MSIKSKLSVACVLFVLINASMAAFFQLSQHRMAALGIDIYDRAFMAMSYLRSSQNSLARLRIIVERPTAASARDGRAEAARADPEAVGIVYDVRSDVEVARDRAMSEEGARATAALAARLAKLEADLKARDAGSLRAEVGQIQESFDTAIEIYAGDGYSTRRKMQEAADRSFRDLWVALGSSVALAVVISLALWRSIVPALRSAVGIARAISAGKLDSVFPAAGVDETAILLRTLSDMQDSLVDKMARIDDLAREASARAAELTVQNGRFEAALDNMHHGLCMVDADHRLVVANHRFADMFGTIPARGGDLTEWSLFPGLDAWFREEAPMTQELADGRVIRVSCRPVGDGGWVVTFEDVTERHHVEATLVRLARHDALTGLPNRVLFRETLLDLLAEGGTPSGPTVLYLDLDGFKSVNDTLGHGVGDDLLQSVAARLTGCLGSAELIARLGGDEFGVILRSGDADAAERHAGAVVEAMRQPFDLSPHRITLGASVGIASRRQGIVAEGFDLSTTLMKNADVALYRAKAEGRGTYRFHSDDLDAQMSEKRSLEADLRGALERQELALVFQPIVAAEGHGLNGFEALLRWHHPQRGTVSPMTFVPIAEETGLIGAIGRWVLRTACAEAATWPEGAKVAVNLSPVQFRQGFLAADVMQALEEAQLAPHCLELEITESVLIQDSDAVIATLTQLRTMGVRIALDDFGTGYSSLSYLRRFPFDKFKIDRSFVQNLATPDSLAILRAMTGLGRALDITVVAEGIETAAQAEQLRREGCSELQGYHFGRPEPARTLPDVIRRLAAVSDHEVRLVG